MVGRFAYSITEVLITRPHTRPERAAWLSRLCRGVLRAVGVTYAAEGPVPQAGAVITNHLSYVDIMVHASLRPCVFVSKAELRKTPVLGWLSMMAGTTYVERGAGGSAEAAAAGMGKGFRDHLPVVFFPEGTTGVGDEPAMPFRSGLLAQALAAGAPVTPGFIRYELGPADRAAGRTVHDDVAWGKQTMLAHLWNFMGLHPMHAVIKFAPEPIAFSAEAQADRKIAAAEAREAVLTLAGDAHPVAAPERSRQSAEAADPVLSPAAAVPSR